MTMNGDQYRSAAISDRGLNESRPQNEDSYLELRPHGIFAVADGVGGAQAGEVASEMAVEIIGEAFVNIGDTDPEDTMRIAIERANGAIFQMSRDLPQLSSMATTLVALHVAGDIATLAHVGDSRIYRVDPAGTLFRETDDHSVVEEEVRAGRMTPEQALVHPSRNVISRALGAEDTVFPDVKMLIVHPGTTFLLCSDGITRHIDDSEMESLLAADIEPAEVCERMKEICYSRGADDNLTAVIVRFPREMQSSVTVEDEQVTVATARSPFDSVAENDSAVPGETINIAEELAVESDSPLSADAHDDGSYLFEDSEIFPESETDDAGEEYTSSSVIVPAKEEPKDVPAPVPVQATANYTAETPAEAKSSFGKAASAIVLLVIGGLIGLAASYFLLSPKQQPPAAVQTPIITEQKSDNISLTAFEEGRRAVDADPAKYIKGNPSPQVAEDYFLLARAFLLNGQYWDAKRFYNMAKDRLSQAEEKNSKTMATEIAMALAIIDSPQATQEFARQTAASALNTANANVNSGGNTNQPVP